MTVIRMGEIFNEENKRFSLLTICMTTTLCFLMLCLVLIGLFAKDNEVVIMGSIGSVAGVGLTNLYILMRQESNRHAAEDRSKGIKQEIVETRAEAKVAATKAEEAATTVKAELNGKLKALIIEAVDAAVDDKFSAVMQDLRDEVHKIKHATVNLVERDKARHEKPVVEQLIRERGEITPQGAKP